MTYNEFIKIFEENGNDFTLAISVLAHERTELYHYDFLKNMVNEEIKNNRLDSARTIIDNLTTDYKWYRCSHNEYGFYEVYPVKDSDDVSDLFDDETNTGEITIESIKKFIYDNGTAVDELFDEEDIKDYVRDNMSMTEAYDEDDIIEWVKDNCDLDDLIDVDIRWS